MKTKHISKHLENSYHMYLGYVYADALVRADTHVVMEKHTEYPDWQVTYGHARVSSVMKECEILTFTHIY